jgi:hypothetical protein
VYNNGGNGGAISCWGNNADPYFENVTIEGNIGSPNGIYTGNSSSGNFTNSIIADTYYFHGSSGMSFSYTNDGSSDPLFVAPENNDFHLQPGSPCIDAGDPIPEYNDTDGTRNDMGAYGGPNGDW